MATDFMEQMRVVFRAEALDLLAELDSALLALEDAPGDTALVHRVFRAIHTIKGSGGTAGFRRVAEFAHKVEEAFDLARDGHLEITPELIDCGLRACDVIRLILDANDESVSVAEEYEVAEAIATLVPASAATAMESKPAAAPPVEQRAVFEIRFQPNRRIFSSGADPATLLAELRDLGQAHVTAHVSDVPPLASLDAESCYLWWDIVLVTISSEAMVRDVFVFVEDDCDITIRLREDQEADLALFGAVPVEAFDLFVAECEDHLETLEVRAIAFEQDPSAKETIDSLFRGFHSIKANAGLLLGHVQDTSLLARHPLRQLQRLAHGMESLLEPFRGPASAPATSDVSQTALETCDAIRMLLRSLLHQQSATLISPDLLTRLGIAPDSLSPLPGAKSREDAFHKASAQCLELISGCLQLLDCGDGPPLEILQTYRRGIQMLSTATRYHSCPDLEGPLSRQLLLLDQAIRDGEGLSPASRQGLEREFQAIHAVLGGAVPDTPRPATGAAPSAKAATSEPAATIRIEQNKLDRLMRIVGELLVARGAFAPLIQRLQESEQSFGLGKELKVAESNITRIADELQSSVISIRMMPLKSVFQRFPRLVRDLARSLGKDVRLVMEGETIELDKTILEQIGDPLVHIIRNAIDHGLETPEMRRECGKDPGGQLTLRARQEAGGVTIEVADDGKGLDAEALKRKAVAKGLLSPEEAVAMSEEAAFQLLFLPGLSTAAQVTDVSGRGVGMDVVRSNVRNLHGSIDIRSKRGAGASFLIRLPASLMISKGILFEAAGQEYILPLHCIRDMVKLRLADTHEFQGIRLGQVRGTVYSIFQLAELFGLPARPAAELSVVVVDTGSLTYGLAVDRFVSEVEILIKPLPAGLEKCREFQGAAILGDGRVVLVINPLECHHLRQAMSY
jgi:two-component system chemotaxis sensor kinase CheA